MKFKLIDRDKRANAKCYFCGKNQSVKYEVRIFDDDSIEDINLRYCCNRCVCMFADELEDLE